MCHLNIFGFVLDKERLGRYRWVVERTHAWFAGFGKLRIICSRFVDDLC